MGRHLDVMILKVFSNYNDLCFCHSTREKKKKEEFALLSLIRPQLQIKKNKAVLKISALKDSLCCPKHTVKRYLRADPLRTLYGFPPVPYLNASQPLRC